MSRVFNGTNQYLTYASGGVVASYPLSVSAWVRQPAGAGSGVVFGLFDNTVTNRYVYLEFNLTNDRTYVYSRDGTESFAQSGAAGASADTWIHVGGVWASTTSRKAFAAGSPGSTNTSLSTFPAVTHTSIGRRERPVPDRYFSGQVAYPAAWNVALSDAQMADLASGAHPDTIEPGSRVSLWPLTGNQSPEPDSWGIFDMTVHGATYSASDPAVDPPPGGGWSPAWAANRNVLLP